VTVQNEVEEMKREIIVALLVMCSFLVLGCTPSAGKLNQTGVYVSFFNETENTEPTLIVIEEEPVEPEQPLMPEEPETEVGEAQPIVEQPTEVQPTGIPVRNYVEGDLVELNVTATDPDGDVLEVTFSPPLDEGGSWQTVVGDAGQYRIRIEVSDGKTSVSKEVLIIVEPKNNPPVIIIEPEITVKEGESVVLEPIVTDQDGDEVTVKFTGWMTSPSYKTSFEDAGSYIVTIIATDGVASVAKDVKVNVLNVNRPPVISGLEPISAIEGSLVVLNPVVMDPDGDEIVVSFTQPFDNKGDWQTAEGDAGDYDVTVTATDGEAVVTDTVKVIITPLNRPPVIQRMDDIEVKEGETVTISPVIIDPDGDPFSITFSGWMTSPSYKTNYDDSGVHIVTITATDTKGASSTQNVKVTVIDVNRPPEIVLE
jgi:hypothetical protein